jgi:hypothetical protein
MSSRFRPTEIGPSSCRSSPPEVVIMIELIRTLDEVMALRAEWDRLYLESNESNPFLTHRWVTTLLRHITPEFAVAALRVAPGAPLDAVLPFEVHGDHWSTLNEHSARPGVLARADQRYALPTILLDLLLREPRAQDARRLLLRDVSAWPAGCRRCAESSAPWPWSPSTRGRRRRT